MALIEHQFMSRDLVNWNEGGSIQIGIEPSLFPDSLF
jgi:hypothetical protein